MSGTRPKYWCCTRHKYWPWPGPIDYVPEKDPKLLKAILEQWRAKGIIESYKQAQERPREILSARSSRTTRFVALLSILNWSRAIVVAIRKVWRKL